MLERQELKDFVHFFIGKRMGGYIKTLPPTLFNQEVFDKISVTEEKDEGMTQLATFFDGEIAAYAIQKHTDIKTYEAPNIAKMPSLDERQKQYLTYFQSFLEEAGEKITNKELLENFRKAIIESVMSNKHHLLKRTKVRALLIWRVEDNFLETNTVLTELKKITVNLTKRPS